MTTLGPATESDDSPRGREAVRRALLDAAAELFAEQGPARVSVREVADRAHVNHGLVHRHFGSKEGLLRAVLESLSGRIWQGARISSPAGAAEVDVAATLRRALAATLDSPLYFRVLARALLDGHRPRDVQGAYPVVQELVMAVERGRERGVVDPRVDPSMSVALLVSTALGWLVFEPYLLAATGQDGLPPETVQARLAETWKLLASLAAAPRA